MSSSSKHIFVTTNGHLIILQTHACTHTVSKQNVIILVSENYPKHGISVPHHALLLSLPLIIGHVNLVSLAFRGMDSLLQF